MQITSNELDRMLRLMFNAGENWGHCYGGWFSPTEKQKEETYQEALKDLIAENKDICEDCEPVENQKCDRCLGC